jgi:Amt family ammonium transporter
MSALIIGFIAGIFCFFMVTVVKGWFGYDDSLDAFGVHGAGGTIGALLTGFFASSAINPIFGNGKPTGAVDGNWHQILNQLAGIAIAWGLSIVGTLILLKLVDMLVGLRVTREEEIEGLDVTQHGEEGYDFAS